MRILLVKPQSTVFHNIAVPPLGLQYLSAVVKAAGYQNVKIVHMDAQGMDADDWENEVRAFHPDIVGLSVIVSEAVSMDAVAVRTKKIAPQCLVVAGGAYPSLFPEKCLKNAAIDLVVRGEGEKTFLEIVKCFEQGLSSDEIKGVAFRGKDAVCYAPQREFCHRLDDIPSPDYEGLDLDSYNNLIPQSPLLFKQKHVRVLTSRGCPYQCGFCFPTMGRVFRPHSADRVIGEILRLCERRQTRNVEIIDDVFNFDRERAMEIMRKIVKADRGLKIYFPSGVRGDLLDREMIDLFKTAGVVFMPVGIETASKRKQVEIGKNMDLDRLQINIAYAVKKRIFMNGYFILGFPGETIREVLRTIFFACKLKLHTASFFALHCYEGSAFARVVDVRKVITAQSAFSLFSAPIHFVNASSLNKVVIVFLRQFANVMFYCNPFRLLRIIKDLPEKQCLVFLAKQFLNRVVSF